MIVKLSGITFIAGFIIAGLTIRFNWYVYREVLLELVLVFFLSGYAVYAEVLRENAYVKRIKNEERFLEENLEGYCD